MSERDIKGKDIFAWSEREFSEEVNYSGEHTITVLGVLNDDRDEVGKVHLGLVILMEGESDQISVRDEHVEGQLLTIQQIRDKVKETNGQLEGWSQLVLDFLETNQK